MTKIEESARNLVEILRSGYPEDVIHQQFATMAYAEGYKAGIMASKLLPPDHDRASTKQAAVI